jgi:hypothetical protein
MTCQSARDSILDLARGLAIPPPALRVLEEHLNHCDACAAELQRQRDLSAGLDALAAEAPQWTAPAALEDRLLGQFAAMHRHASPSQPRGHARRAVWYGAAAAAAVVCAAWLGTRPSIGQPPAAPAVHTDSRDAAPTVAGPDSAATSRAANETARDPTPARAGQHAGRRPRPATTARGQARPVEFTVLPDALGLPAFESGTIVRVEVPIATLPEYGLKIPPDAARSNVEADLLVGQDGQARAIRLVSEPDHSRSRQ